MCLCLIRTKIYGTQTWTGMPSLKSVLFEEHFGRGRLIENEVSGPEDDSPNDRASNYSDYQELDEFSHIESNQTLAKTESFNSMPELANCKETAFGSQFKSLLSLADDKYEVLPNPEFFSPDPDNCSGNIKRWSLLLRCLPLSRQKLSHNGKIWRPVLIKLEESTLKFHAEGFESSPPFKVINLSWFYSFSGQGIKAKLLHNEFLFTTVLVNSLLSMRGRFAKSRSNFLKLGSASYTVLLDFIDTVKKCVASFPAFRPAGISYKTEKVLINIKDIYEVTQQERNRYVSSKHVEIVLKAKISASPECSVRVKHAEDFSKKPDLDDVSFHKCVNSRLLNNQTVIARFLPLDNCWFQIMSWNGCCSKPTPLRCEVTVTMFGNSSIELHARLFTGSTRLDVKSASNITLRFYIPSEWLETAEKDAEKSLQHCTNVSKGNVSYGSNAETMLWSIPKLSFNPCRNYYLSGKPLATLNSQFQPPPCSNTEELVKVPVAMVFYTKGSPQSSEVAITSMKLGVKSFGKFKTSYTSLYRVTIPLTVNTRR